MNALGRNTARYWDMEASDSARTSWRFEDHFCHLRDMTDESDFGRRSGTYAPRLVGRLSIVAL